MVKKIIGVLGLVLLALVSAGLFRYYYAGSVTSRFEGPVAPGEPVPPALVSDLEKYFVKLMREFELPGAAMVLVQGDQVIYSNAFGVRDLQTKTPVDTQTLFGIGSSTKPLTAVMVASLVDEGLIRWNTRMMDILPTFTMSNPEIAQQVTFMHSLCMCTGVPRRMEDISVQYEEMSAEDMIESLANIQLTGRLGQHYAYSERMFSAGGYLAALAAGGEYGHLAEAYSQLMQERLFDPLGMSSTTLSIDEAVASGNYATPHYSSLTSYHAILPEVEGMFTPIAPTGAIWSNADDLGKILVMLLQDGVSAEGQRLVSAENLAYIWQPRTAIDATYTYGLGWNVEEVNGLTILHHPGGTAGFMSELVIIPEYNLGFAVLINRLDMLHQAGRMTTYRLLEMLTGSEQTHDHEARLAAQEMERQIPLLLLVTRKTMPPDKIAPFLGRYQNAALGEIQLVQHDDRSVWIDFGEYESPIRPLVLEENQYIFFESIFLGKTIQMNLDAGGKPSMKWTGDEASYAFVFIDSQVSK